jgi:hypothetical protein
MTCSEAGLREDAAFTDLVRAVAHRRSVDAKIAIYNDHWQGYEAALQDLQAAVQGYTLALDALQEARRHHKDVPSK